MVASGNHSQTGEKSATLPGMQLTEETFPKAYVAGEHETPTYTAWETMGAFSPRAKTSEDTKDTHFSLVTPPANANGNLHMGHALTFTLEDIMVRYHRMKGFRTVMIPGTDHAGLETQVVFEKHLEKEGRSRFQMTREQFYKEAMEFTLSNKGNIEAQIKMMGTSVDWKANRFTLDDAVLDRVYTTFRSMYEEGLIYRGERIVNYSVKYRTAYSDIELVHEERQDPLYYIKYGPITIATVRPETKFGDKHIVVHPEDERYKQYIGQSFEVQIATGEMVQMHVIADDAIKPEFGTGAMTITPAHDSIDFEIAQRHNLPIIPIIGLDGKLLPIAGEFAGIKAAEARKLIAARLEELGLLEKVDTTYKHSVALCYKSMQPIEPLVMPQWYVKVEPLVEPVIKAIEAGKVEYHPESFKKIQLDWLRNLRDWNISRQIWWGIPINAAMPENPDIAKDLDTFDTWFSSSQWPVAVLEAMGNDWLDDFYPTTVMETGRDLIFSWVTRMLMMGIYLRGDVPFKHVYFHGMVLDKQGKKMSKSKGNVVSPVDLVAKYGADAVRFGLLVGSSAGSDIPMPEEKIIGGRNFANKLWNISRFVLMQLGERAVSELPVVSFSEDANNMVSVDLGEGSTATLTDADRDILTKLAEATSEATEHLDNYRFAQALQALHEFTWHQFADVYVEAAKSQKDDNGQVDATTCSILFHVLESSLKMLHPFMPFVTEAIWQRLPERETMLIVAPWPGK